MVYACFEHEERELLGRLLALEIAEEGGDEEARFKFSLGAARGFERAWLEQEVLDERGYAPPTSASARADRLWVIKASGSTTGVLNWPVMSSRRQVEPRCSWSTTCRKWHPTVGLSTMGIG